MHLLHFIYDHPENPWLGGGGALRAAAINTHLQRMGHRVTYVSGGFPACPHGKASPHGTSYFTSPSPSYACSRLRYSLEARRLFKSLLQELPPVDLVVDDLSVFSYPLPALVWKGPRVSILHNYLGVRSFRKLGPLGIIPWLAEQYYLRHMGHALAVSEDLKSQIDRRNADSRAEVIYNGIDPEAFRPPRDAVEGRIGFIGRLEIHQKGLDLLLEALRLVFASHPEAHAVFIGGGKDEARLRAQSQDPLLHGRIRFTGRLGKERFTELQDCSLVCMPSRYEGWGITALEAAALGRPVVGSRIPGLREAIRDKETGLLCDLDPKAIASSLCQLLENPGLRQELGEKASLWASHFKWEEVAVQQLHAYSQAMAQFPVSSVPGQ